MMFFPCLCNYQPEDTHDFVYLLVSQERVLKSGNEIVDEAAGSVEPHQKEGYAVDRCQENGQNIWGQTLVSRMVTKLRPVGVRVTMHIMFVLFEW